MAGMTRLTITLALAAIIGSPTIRAGADDMPKLDFASTCRKEVSRQNRGSLDACLADEQKAGEQLAKQWEQFAADIRSACTQMVRTFDPSYVELLTCMETRRDAKKLQEP